MDLLAWALSRRPEGLQVIDGLVRSRGQDAEFVRTLISVVGVVGSPESVKLLFSWLDNPELDAYQKEVLVGLHAIRESSRADLEELYRQMGENTSDPWPPRFRPHVDASTNPVILAATIAHLDAKYPPDLRNKAAEILVTVVTAEAKLEALDPTTRQELATSFVTLLDSPPDSRYHEAAIRFFGSVVDPRAAPLLEREFDQSGRSRLRGALAHALARQATTIDDIRRTIERIRQDPTPIVRLSGAGGFAAGTIGGADDRAIAAELFSGWARAEPDEQVRQQLVYQLVKLLPESQPYMGWAQQDPSAVVRDEALRLLDRWEKYGKN